MSVMCVCENFPFRMMTLDYDVSPLEYVGDQVFDISGQRGDGCIRLNHTCQCSTFFQPPQAGLGVMEPPSLQRKSGSLNDWTISIAGQEAFAEWKGTAEMYPFSICMVLRSTKTAIQNRGPHTFEYPELYIFIICPLRYLEGGGRWWS